VWVTIFMSTLHVKMLRYIIQYKICVCVHIQGDSGGICTTLGDDSMSDSKQKSSYEHGSDF
jgi:hypothetical protein